jgi:hypothetical protein
MLFSYNLLPNHSFVLRGRWFSYRKAGEKRHVRMQKNKRKKKERGETETPCCHSEYYHIFIFTLNFSTRAPRTDMHRRTITPFSVFPLSFPCTTRYRNIDIHILYELRVSLAHIHTHVRTQLPYPCTHMLKTRIHALFLFLLFHLF